MTILAMLAGSIIGKLYDPLAWAMIGVIVLLAAMRCPWWATLTTVIVATVANFAIIHPWLIQSGLSLDPARQGRIFFALLVIGFAAHGIGRLIARYSDTDERAA
jgi:hypothetical protein